MLLYALANLLSAVLHHYGAVLISHWSGVACAKGATKPGLKVRELAASGEGRSFPLKERV